MAPDDADDDSVYTVVVNHEQQYSIWPAQRELPRGWDVVGKMGPKSECLAYIEAVWTDMRPSSLRREAQSIDETLGDRDADGSDTGTSDQGPSLIQRLSSGRHPVEAVLRPQRTALALKECIDRQSVLIRFVQTRGPTELCVRLDAAASQTDQADFENGRGSVHLEGDLNLNGEPVRCIADLDVATLAGEGHLVMLAVRPRGSDQ